MYTRRKVYSIAQDENGEDKLFSTTDVEFDDMYDDLEEREFSRVSDFFKRHGIMKASAADKARFAGENAVKIARKQAKAVKKWVKKNPKLAAAAGVGIIGAGAAGAYGATKGFSDYEDYYDNLYENLYSDYDDLYDDYDLEQREFNSKAQKALRKNAIEMEYHIERDKLMRAAKDTLGQLSNEERVAAIKKIEDKALAKARAANHAAGIDRLAVKEKMLEGARKTAAAAGRKAGHKAGLWKGLLGGVGAGAAATGAGAYAYMKRQAEKAARKNKIAAAAGLGALGLGTAGAYALGKHNSK